MFENSMYNQADYQITEFEGDDPQWLFDLLTNPAFDKVPPSHQQGLYQRFESMPVEAGQVVVRQGDAGDYYYLIRQGKAQVARTGDGGKSIVLAELGPGRGFGEEALISGKSRNATVTMLEPGLLMRLSAENFESLLREPLVDNMDVAAARELMKQGAQLVDVRSEDEFRKGSLEGAVNVPLFLLRIKASQFDRKRPLLLFCNDGRLSATAAFLLTQNGFQTHVLAGGLTGFKAFLAARQAKA